MIVVGTVLGRGEPDELALGIARRAAAAGARTEIVGAVPAGSAGDRLLLDLASAGVGHATVQRTTADLEPADVDLALRYLPDVRAVVLVRPARALLPAAAAAAAWSGASLVVVDDVEPPDELAVAPLVLAPPERDPDGTFGGFVADLAARLDRGLEPRRAWDDTVSSLAADRVDGVDRAATPG